MSSEPIPENVIINDTDIQDRVNIPIIEEVVTSNTLVIVEK